MGGSCVASIDALKCSTSEHTDTVDEFISFQSSSLYSLVMELTSASEHGSRTF